MNVQSALQFDWSKNERDVIAGACILITNRYLTVGYGIYQGDLNVVPLIFNSKFKEAGGDTWRILLPENATRDQFEKAYVNALESLPENLNVLTIASCITLVSDFSIDRDASKNPIESDYGRISKSSTFKNWNDIHLWALADNVLKKRAFNKYNIFVRSDVSLGSLGEFYWQLTHDKLPFNSELADIESEYAKRLAVQRTNTLAFAKISYDINAGFTLAGELEGGKSHPCLGIIRPRLYEILDNEGNSKVEDYEGCCAYHGDCFYGLISEKAIADRLGFKNKIKDFYEKSHEHWNSDHWIWNLVAFYMAQLCTIIVATHAPSRIVIGGRFISDLNTGRKNQDLIIKISSEFKEQIRLGKPGVGIPHYKELFHEDFIQSPNCAMPIVYGGIIFGVKKMKSSQRGL